MKTRRYRYTAALTAAAAAALSLCAPVYAQSDTQYPSQGFVEAFDVSMVSYSDNMFAESSFKYSHELAVFAAYLSASEYLVSAKELQIKCAQGGI